MKVVPSIKTQLEANTTQLSDTTKSRGRGYTANPSSGSWNLFKTVAKVACCALLLFGNALAASQPDMLCPKPMPFNPPACSTHNYVELNTLPDHIRPFAASISADHVPIYSQRQQFPAGLGNFVHPEVAVYGEGDRGCEIEQNDNDVHLLLLCDKYSKMVKNQFDKDPLQKRAVYTEQAFAEKGTNIDLQSDHREPINKFQIQLGVNPQQKTNFQNALKLLENRFLESSQFYQQDEKNIVRFISKLHATLTVKLVTSQGRPIHAGKYRTEYIQVFKELKEVHSIEVYRSYLQTQLKVSDTELAAFNASLSTFANYPDKMGGEIYYHMSPEQQAVWNKLAFVPSKPAQIEKDMQDFARDWKKYGIMNVHPIALAAWVHHRLGAIHPFNDANGRLSRVLMNAILVRGGFHPAIIQNDAEYTQALFDEADSPGSFARYLANKAIPWTEKHSLWLLPPKGLLEELKSYGKAKA